MPSLRGKKGDNDTPPVSRSLLLTHPQFLSSSHFVFLFWSEFSLSVIMSASSEDRQPAACVCVCVCVCVRSHSECNDSPGRSQCSQTVPPPPPVSRWICHTPDSGTDCGSESKCCHWSEIRPAFFSCNSAVWIQTGDGYGRKVDGGS